MDRKQAQRINQARELYAGGKTQKEIALLMGVSEQSVSKWKTIAQGSSADWDKAREEAKTVVSPSKWLEDKIALYMQLIDEAEEEGKAVPPLQNMLAKYIDMKKRLDTSTDKYGEIRRVMEDFIGYVKENHADVLDILKEVIEGYIRQAGRNG